MSNITSTPSGYSVAFDVGGTFTDIVAVDTNGALAIEKVLTTPTDPADGARLGIEAALGQLSATVGDVGLGVHGTTLVTNAIIERRGARTGMITTLGLEDVIEIGLGERYDMYDLFLPFPDPLVERRLRIGVRGRIDSQGHEVTPLDEDDVRRALLALTEEGIEAVAICLINSHANPDHEHHVARIARAEFRSLAITLSSDIAGQLGEYERFSTAVANAYVQPLLDRYLEQLDEWLENGRLLLMGSNGGTLSVDVARRKPIIMIESGPAAGALAATAYARRLRRDHVVSFDMGGTTAKICLIDGCEPQMSADFEAARAERFKPGSGIPLRIPVIDLIEIGAGGGSIAHRNELGLLKVGPSSAGAEPGPACYGRGGTRPTVTDANLLLGYLGASSFLGGTMVLDIDTARGTIDSLARGLELDTVRTAWGIHDVVNESMAAAMRSHIAERNRDPRNYSMFAFGGAGPVHAVAVARKVGIPEVIVPLGAGVTSALGLLTAPMAVDLVRSVPTRLDDIDWADVAGLLEELARDARSMLALADEEEQVLTVEYSCDMRYLGQAHEISVRLPTAPTDPRAAVALCQAFDDAYLNLYSVLNEKFEIEVLNWRVRVAGKPNQLWFDVAAKTGGAATSSRPIFDPVQAQFVEAPVHRHETMAPGVVHEGPLIVEQRETSVVVGAQDTLAVDQLGNIIVSVGQ